MVDVVAAARFAQGFLDPEMRGGSYSMGFLIDLAREGLLNQLNVFSIIEEVAGLEGSGTRPPSTKPAAMFMRRHLLGYWHKHHTQAAYIPENLRLEMHKDDTVEPVLGKYEGQIFTEAMAKELTNAIVHENYARRSQDARLTGEWIVYSCAGNQNYYITLARHDEGDEVIAERLHRYEDVDRRTGWVSGKSTLTYGDAPPPVQDEGGSDAL